MILFFQAEKDRIKRKKGQMNMKRLVAIALVLMLLVGLAAEAVAVDKSSYFASHNLERYLFTMKDAEGEGLPFQSRTYKKKNTETMGSVTAKWAKVVLPNTQASPKCYVPLGADPVTVKVEDKKIVTQFSNLTGYEWRGVRLALKFRDSNTKKYGASILWVLADLYTGEYYDNFAKTKGKYQYSDFTVEKDGKSYNGCRAITWSTSSSSSSSINYKVYAFIRVPIGYDGATVGLPNTVGRSIKTGYNENNSTLASEYKNGGIIFQLSDEEQDEFPLEKREKTLTSSEYKKWYKSCCSSISYKKLSRDPRKYDGRKIKFTGYVVQVCDEVSGYGWGYNEYRLATKGKYGDVIYVNIPGRLDRRILEGDKITVWGEYDGLITYTTIFGGSVTIPEMTAEYYSIK